MNLFRILIFFIASESLSAALQNNNNMPKLVVGLISKCNDTNIMGTFASQNIRNSVRLTAAYYNYTYKEIDVCEDEPLLIELLINITLDMSWYHDDTDILKVTSIIAYMPEHMLKTTVMVLSFTDIAVFPLTKTYDDSWYEHQNNVEPVYRIGLVTETIIARMLLKNKWKNTAIYEISENKKSALHIKGLQDTLPKHCIRYFSLTSRFLFNATGKIGLMYEQLIADTDLKVVILVGSVAAKFMIDADKFGVQKYWILFTRFKGSQILSPEFVSVTNTRNGHQLLEISAYQNASSVKNMRHLHPFMRIMKATILNIFPRLVTGGASKKLQINQHLTRNDTSYTALDDVEVIDTPHVQSIREFKQSLKIKIQNCSRTTISQVESNIYTRKIDFVCGSCEFPFAKNKYGGCTRCKQNTRPFSNQSGCYNPNLEEKVFLEVHIIDGIGGLLSLFILIVFIKDRATPVVRSSDFPLSIIQLTFCLLMFLLFPAFTLSKVSTLTCTLRQTVLNLLLVGCISIVVCKTEKIMIICSMMTRLTEKDKRDIFIRQMLIFGFMMGLEIIIVISFFPFPVVPTESVADKIDGNEYLVKHCHMGKNNVIQLFYCTSIFLLSIIQAYRVRSLPNAFNEGNAILISSAISACCLVFLAIFTSTQENGNCDDLQTASWISISISMICLLICLYGPKMYIIICESSKNNRSYLKTYVASMGSTENFLEEPRELTSRHHTEGNKILVVQDSNANCERQTLLVLVDVTGRNIVADT